MTLSSRKSTLLLTVFLSFFSFIALSAQLPSNISPQQLEQFKKLSPAQQKSLAASMGVDLGTIQSQIKKNNPSEDSTKNLQQYYPRGTQFDEMGNSTGLSEEDLAEEDEDELKPFGYDVFANAPLTFAPSIDIAIPDNYTIGTGDVLSVQMFGKENNDYELAVSREGKVVFPELGAFKVVGMTFEEVKSYLKNEIQNKILGVDVVITLAELRSIRVFVLGEAFKPGNYLLSSLSSITHAIFAAGGISEIGSLRNVQLKRAGKLVSSLDLYDLLINGDSSNDVLLKSGDVIFIPPVGDSISIVGEVRRPAIYELKETENLSSVIQMSGGLLPSAYPSSTIVERYSKNNLRTVLNLDLNDRGILQSKVYNGDVIKVMKTSEFLGQSITVIGAVSRPGKYQWKKGQKITDLLPNIYSYISSDADLNYSLIVREIDESRRIEILQFSLINITQNKNHLDNLYLKPQDKIIVFSKNEYDVNDSFELNSYAMTRDELDKKEKKEAKESFKEKIFWSEYGNNKKLEEQLELTPLEITSKSLTQLSGGIKEEDSTSKRLNLFSRQKLLTPIIEQLKTQSSSGLPLQLVEIVGSVKYPGIYPLAKNIKVNDAIKAAGGLLESAYLSKAEITRNNIHNKMAIKKSLNFNLQSALENKPIDNLVLRSKDRINVLKIPDWQENRIVELKGEFLFPGSYTIRRGEKLSELIERVGGVTKYAYLNGSVLSRESLKADERRNLLKVAEGLRMEVASKKLSQNKGGQMSDYKEISLLLADLTKVKPIGRLVIDLPAIQSQEQTDVLLEDGDVLYIPTKKNSVNVIGQVQVSTSHMYQANLSAEDYINLSGGSKKQADESRIYIIKVNGSIEIPKSSNWFSSQNAYNVDPGDTVVVPLDSDYTDNLSLWASGTQIIYQAAVAIAAISGI